MNHCSHWESARYAKLRLQDFISHSSDRFMHFLHFTNFFVFGHQILYRSSWGSTRLESLISKNKNKKQFIACILCLWSVLRISKLYLTSILILFRHEGACEALT